MTTAALEPGSDPGDLGSPDTELARVSVEFATRVADLTRLADVGAGVAYMIDIQSVLDEIVLAACHGAGTTMGVLWLYDADRDLLWPAAVTGFDRDVVERWGTLRRGEGWCGLALETLAQVVVEDVLTSPLVVGRGQDCVEQGWRSAFSVPMVTLGREVMGTIATYSPEARVPTQRQTRLVEAYARQGAELVERARLHGEARQLSALERRRGLQLRALADTALTLSASETLDDVLRTVTESARDIVGSHQSVTTRLYDGAWTNAVTHVSLSEKYASWREYAVVPRGLGVLNAVTRDRRPLRLTGDELVAHPDWRGLRDSPGHPPLPDYLAAPLLDRAGEVLGLLQLSDKGDEGAFTPEDEAMVVQLAQMASASIEKVELLDRERTARAEAEETARILRILSDASAAFSASLELEETVDAVTSLIVPALADWAGVQLLQDNGTLLLAGSAVSDAEGTEVLLELGRAYVPHIDQEGGAGAVARTGVTQEFPVIDDAVLESVATAEMPVAELRRSQLVVALVVPLNARGRCLGTISLGRLTAGPYTAAEVRLCEDLATRAALALDNARRYAFERSVAVTLQRSLLPNRLPVPDSVVAARRYLPGAEGTSVGGDWYDLFDLGDGRLGLVVGDVMGRGVQAAAIMGQLRVALRAYALDGHEPSEVLRRLDRVVEALGEFQITTCVYGVLDPVSRRLTVAAAGHLPPLVVPVDADPWFLALDPGLPLGVGRTYDGDEPSYSQTELTLPAGGTVVLYTDGLVESPDVPVEEGLSRMRAAAVGEGTDPEALCDRLLLALGRAGHDDDTAVLAVQVNALAAERPEVGIGPEWPVRLELSSAPESVAVARSAITGLLVECGLERMVDDACLLVSEVVTNAVRHAGSHLKVCARAAEGTLRIEVVDRDQGLPVVREAGEHEESGRGLLLVETLAHRWGVAPTEDGGKVVWVELDVSPSLVPSGA